MRHVVAPLLAFGAFVASAQAPSTQADPPAALQHVERAREIAGKDMTSALFLCGTSGNSVIQQTLADGKTRLTPTRAFDNLWYLGSSFVGVWALKTSEGLILIDAGQDLEEARDHIVPELRALGLDPAQIKYVLVTHAHWDHFGGAKYLQDSFGARVGLSAADWHMLAREDAGDPGRMNRDRPRQDLVIQDGQKLTLGDTTVTLYVTPGHTPGTISAIIPVRDGGKVQILSLLGGTAFPPTTQAADRHGGLQGFSQSVQRLAGISRAAGASGLINTHTFVDGSAAHLAAAATARAQGKPNPFIIGTDAVVRHYGVFDECLKAAIARPQKENEWSRPLPKDPVP